MNRSGFSIIEMIIVIAIIALTTGLSIATYSNYNQNKQFEAEVEKVIDTLELAKKKAQAGDIASFACPNYDGYRVNINRASASYSFSLCCALNCGTANLISTVAFLNGVNVKANANVQFKPLTAGVTTVGVPFTIKMGTQCVDISISQIGIVSKGAVYTSGC